ncbi:MAG TPA: ATP-binding protein, partial [Ktedonobacteraceae bacterium]|nr:ATP-binding protein [Ktedonobacteraceae bacterium]
TNTDITKQKQLEQLKDEFIGVVSHELKTPVTSLKGYTQLLKRWFLQASDERTVTMLSKMEAQVNKLTLLIEDLLEVTRIESGKLQLRRSSFDFQSLIREMVEDIQRTSTTHTIEMDLSSPIMLTVDRERIGQVLTNLLTNAVKYSPLADRVVVKTREQQGMVITSVQDFGIGIPKEQQSHIFERFYRVEGEQRRTYPGLGLGLYIAAEFVKRHQGIIWLESSEGKGTTFSFSLPIASSHPTGSQTGEQGGEPV